MKKAANVLMVGIMALTVALFSVKPAFAADAVNWESATITVTGMGIAPPRAVNQAQVRYLARRAAVVDGYRQLAESISGVNVDSETTVENMMILSDVTKTKVSAVIKGARVIDERITSDGGYEVVMQVPMYGVSDSLASAVWQRPEAIQPFPDLVPDVEPSEPVAASTVVTVNVNVNSPAVTSSSQASAPIAAPPVVQAPVAQAPSIQRPAMTQAPVLQSPANRVPSVSVPSLTPAQPVQPKQPVTQVSKSTATPIGGYTSLVVDCRGLDLKPVMSAVIKNANGEAIYGAKNLDPDVVVSKGMVAYVKDGDLTNVARAGSNPLVVKAISVDNFNANPVISVADANRALLENSQTGFLDNLNVVLIR